jgi:hypothetical protein
VVVAAPPASSPSPGDGMAAASGGSSTGGGGGRESYDAFASRRVAQEARYERSFASGSGEFSLPRNHVITESLNPSTDRVDVIAANVHPHSTTLHACVRACM